MRVIIIALYQCSIFNLREYCPCVGLITMSAQFQNSYKKHKTIIRLNSRQHHGMLTLHIPLDTVNLDPHSIGDWLVSCIVLENLVGRNYSWWPNAIAWHSGWRPHHRLNLLGGHTTKNTQYTWDPQALYRTNVHQVSELLERGLVSAHSGSDSPR